MKSEMNIDWQKLSTNDCLVDLKKCLSCLTEGILSYYEVKFGEFAYVILINIAVAINGCAASTSTLHCFYYKNKCSYS